MAAQNRRSDDLIPAFTEFVRHSGFPCLGAKSALARGQIDEVVAGDIRSGSDDGAILRAIYRFLDKRRPDDLFVSIAILFPETGEVDEASFEQALWDRLQAIHDRDRLSCGWDAQVSSDPASAHFSMSIGGAAFYVIGMHPGSSRPARRFGCPALVFNLHRQFETLRASGRYEKLRRLILERDIAANGSANAMLARHGESSEARQYSGRTVGDDWRCPFRARLD